MSVKLRYATVKQIRMLKEQGWTVTELARKFKVSRTAIQNVLSRKTWGWVH